jgi:hypothetical protein
MSKEIIDLDMLVEEDTPPLTHMIQSWRDLKPHDKVRITITGDVVSVLGIFRPFPTLQIRCKETGTKLFHPDSEGCTVEFLHRPERM